MTDPMRTIKDEYPLQGESRYPFYALVPKRWDANLRFRERVLKLGDEDTEWRGQLRRMCELDPLFWISASCWLEEPRAVESCYREVPFILRGYQSRGMDQLLRAVPRRDVCIYKSREVGATWLVLCKAAHDFLFSEGARIGVVSAKAELVDNRDTSSLFSKLDFLLDERRMPWWMFDTDRCVGGLHYVRNAMVLDNPGNSSSINGYACTDDVGRSGRKLWFMMDEFAFWPASQVEASMASIAGNTNCRVGISTANMPGDPFHHWVLDHEKRGIELIDMYWQEDPDKRAGLYTTDAGRLRVVDREFWASLLDCRTGDVERVAREGGCRYDFQLDGKVRSPYFDWAISRAENPRQTERELERRFEGLGGTFFDIGAFDRHRGLWAREPDHRGTFSFDVDTGEVARWHPADDGGVMLWIDWVVDLELRERGVRVPVGRRYVLGADVAAGTGGTSSSNSVAVVVDADTGEQVLEFATGRMRPDRFAGWCCGVARFFNNALLIWDSSGGVGAQFTAALVEDYHYSNLYQHRVVDRISKRETNALGYRILNKEQKDTLLNGLQTAADDGNYMIRSEATYQELPQYVYRDGEVVHSTTVQTTDHSAMKKAHGDRVMAHAITVVGIRSLRDLKKKAPGREAALARNPPFGTLAWRWKEQEEAQARDWWE